MRLAIALILSTALAIPAIVTVSGAPGFAAPKPTEFSSEEKKKKKKTATKKKTEENLKAAPTEPPKENKSTY